jgi:hypothetical protein
LRKGIANVFNKATAFCNVPTCVNSAHGFSLRKRRYLQASRERAICEVPALQKGIALSKRLAIGNRNSQQYEA